MTTEITMPKLSDTMEEGKILRWLKHPGDAIRHGDALAEVETDKADMVMESFDDGVLDEVRLKEGESARVGAVIAILRPAGEAARAGTAASPASAQSSAADDERAESSAVVAKESPAASAVARTSERVTPLRTPGARRRRSGAGSEAQSPSVAAVESDAGDDAAGSSDNGAAIADSLGTPAPMVHPALS